jgi:hypothetical protein
LKWYNTVVNGELERECNYNFFMRSGKMNDTDMEKLEFLVDEYYIPEVVASLGAVCRLRADDVRGTDKEAAKKFETYSDILNDARAKIDAASQG